ncbi:TetR/AcrR family transcriptional regulator [Rheinheimera aquimaris]|uniref:TetR/AcrR family transcriptional regulator n=1 Tax=Rheinheimera aquimaris TaxID=412437 RepID=UPI001E5D788F|nr:TetR family transcriptional regulator [Rheinheimera aquimaris]MCD1597072.1 TetR/AcrR family transcriptional regulator [Rheinheimera aquimaris]
MRASKQHMEKVRSHILDAAGQGFREEGYGGLGINGLAQRAGLTSGAFYGHFMSKSDAFAEVVAKGLNDYANAVADLKQQHADAWPEHFLAYYLGAEHVENLACSCVVPGLSADVMRAEDKTKIIYSALTTRIADSITAGLNKSSSGDSWALMALLAGAVMMARSVSDPTQKKDILSAAQHWAETIIQTK